MTLMADKRQVARAASIVIIAFALSRVLGLVRQMVIAGQFGTGDEMDAYLAAFRLPDILFQLVAGGALASAFIPTFTGYLTRADQIGAWRLASTIINLLLIILTLTAVGSAFIAPWLVRSVVAPGFYEESVTKAALTVRLMRVMLISSVIFGVSGVVMGILNAHQHFLLPAVAPILYNLSIIGGALFLAPSLGVMGLAVGVVVGAALHLLVQVPGLAYFRARYIPVLALGDSGVRQVARLMGPRVMALAVVQLNFLINTNLGSRLGEGAVSALNFAWLLMLLPQGVFAQAVATAAFPTFSAQVARGDRAAVRSTLAATLRGIFVLSLPAAVGLIVLRGPLVALLFERGAFGRTSTDLVAWALLFYALGLVAHAGLEIVARAFYALHDTITPLVIGGGSMLLNVGLSVALPFLFEELGWLPHGGLALANSVATTIELVGLLWIIRGRLGGLQGRQALPTLLRSAASAVLMGLVLGGLPALFPTVKASVLGGIGAVLGVAVYFGSTWVFGVPDVREIMQFFRRGVFRSRKGKAKG